MRCSLPRCGNHGPLGNPDDGNPGTLIFKFATGKEDGFATKHLVDTVIQKCNKVLGRIAEAVGLPP